MKMHWFTMLEQNQTPNKNYLLVANLTLSNPKHMSFVYNLKNTFKSKLIHLKLKSSENN